MDKRRKIDALDDNLEPQFLTLQGVCDDLSKLQTLRVIANDLEQTTFGPFGRFSTLPTEIL